jgi:hypothetical protein
VYDDEEEEAGFVAMPPVVGAERGPLFLIFAWTYLVIEKVRPAIERSNNT